MLIPAKKTLLIGADLRKPKIFDDFDLKNEVGLSNYLARTVSKEEIVQPTKIKNLDVITGGLIPPNPSELIMSDTMNELMQELKEGV